MSLRLTTTVALAALLGASLQGCKENPKAEEQQQVALTTADSVQSTATASFFQALPSPLHVARVFKRSGLRFVEGTGNDPAKASDYVTQTGRALNLGVYSTDLAYASLNSQNQASINYFKTVRLLSDKLNMASMIDAYNIMRRFEDNMGNQDSLIRLLADMHMESDMLLQTTNRHEVLFLSFSGGLTESLYLATNHLRTNYTEELTDRIVEQAVVIGKLVSLLEMQPNRTDYQFLIDGLKDIHTELVAMQGVNKLTDMKQYKTLATTVLPTKVEALRKQVVATN